jgi:predicted helicase
MGQFEVIICDEAHRTTGVTVKGEESSSFTKVHDASLLNGKKRLYMTATPRLYDETSKKKAEDDDTLLCSMDDPTMYGEEFYRIGFGQAVEEGLLSDYKVLILTLNEKDVPLGIQNMVASRETEINADDASKLIGCINALSKKVVGDDGSIKATDPLPMRRAVAFCSNIAVSKRITTTFNEAGSVYLDSLPSREKRSMVRMASQHIDGAMNAPQRDELMSWLRSENTGENECRILTNVRCLSEGVDVPSLDAVLFLSPRNSQVDVVQSVGRVMRKSPGKNYGYIIIPIVIPSDVSPERALEDNERFKVVWTVLNALRAHDDRFNATVNKIELNRHKPDNILVGRPEHLFDDEGNVVRESAGQYGDIGRQLSMHFEELQSAVYARLVKKVGDRQYWEQWAQSVGEIAEKQVRRITALVEKDTSHSKAFDSFMKGLHKNINPSITQQEAIEMLSQHIITRPVFDALFEGYSFVENNPVSIAMQAMLDKLEGQAFEKDAEVLNRFYESVRRRAAGIDNAEGKQRIIIELYDKFFKTAFPKLVEKLGIVYTPVEVVDYIIHSVDDLLKQEFGKSLSSEGVHILDPFTGTGTFITRILQSGLIKPEDLKRKYTQELHANEMVLLAYYIAAINAENTYHDLQGETSAYVPFEGICLTDTFQLGEEDGSGTLYSDMFPKNSSRVEAQKKSKIQVIVGNPPYSVGQGSANDNAQNQSYPRLEASIEQTYAFRSVQTSVKSLYDSYIKAFKWSSQRLDSQKGGIIGFVTNGSWLDGNSNDGMRKCLAEEFTSIYVFNLRGNQRTSGEKSRQEGGKIFGSGSRTPVSICFLVKNPKVKVDRATIYYRDIGDYLTREEKLTIVSSAGSMISKEMKWKVIQPNKEGDWINQRSQLFETMIPLGDKKGKSDRTAFKPIYSLGLNSNRDSVVFNFSSKQVGDSVREMMDSFNSCLTELSGLNTQELKSLLPLSNPKLSWTDPYILKCSRGEGFEFKNSSIVRAIYRPFQSVHLYFQRDVIHRPGNFNLYFTSGRENRVIAISGTGGSKPFSCLMVGKVMSLDAVEKSQCFPLWYWEEEKAGDLFASSGRQCGLTDWFISEGKKRFGQEVTPEDLFYYIYGLLHTKSYRKAFEDDVKKVLARVTLDVTQEQFEALRDAGRKMGDLHINYESVPPHPSVTVTGDELGDFRVKKLKHPSKGQTDQIIYNSHITISNIPEKAYQYEVNGRSAIGWILDRYQVTTDQDSGITNDPNDWAEEVGNPRYILDLILSVIHVSTQTVDIVNSLPELDFS